MRTFVVAATMVLGFYAYGEETAQPVPSNAEAGSPVVAGQPEPQKPAEAMAEAATPPAPPTKWSERITLEALADTYFSARFASANATDTSELRGFDAGNGRFIIAYAELAAAMTAEPAGFRLDLGFGPVADITSELTPVAGFTLPSEVLKHIQQAYASFKMPGKLAITLDVGKFVTNAGAEVIEAKGNWNYSRSLLFNFAIPFTHTGARLGVVLNDRLTLQASLVNGWDSVLNDGADKTLGLSAFFNTAGGTTAALNLYAGPEGGAFWRVLADLVVGHAFGALALNLNADYAFEGTTKWYGVSLMGRYTLTDWAAVAVRAEHFQDPDGARLGGAAQNVTEATGTFSYLFGKNAELRLELRHDIANTSVFRGGASTNQTTVQVGALAWF